MKLFTDFKIEDSVMVLVDVQERLFSVIEKPDFFKEQTIKCLLAADAIELPVIVSEQYPKGLGRTIEDLKSNLPKEYDYIEKTSFSCFREKSFTEAVKKLGIKNIILIGMETHVCIMQTALDALDKSFNCAVITDAVISRNEYDRKAGLSLMKHSGVTLLTFESLFMLLLRDSTHAKFKNISNLLKS